MWRAIPVGHGHAHKGEWVSWGRPKLGVDERDGRQECRRERRCLSRTLDTVKEIMDRVHAGPEREREEGGTCSADEYYLVLLPPSIVLRKGMTRVSLSRQRLPFRAEEGAPCHFFHPAAPLSARACRRALACAQAPPPWHALPLRRIRLRMHNSTAPPYPDPRDPATDSAAPTALLTAAASLPCARRGLSATMFKNTFQSGFLSILYSIGACTLCFKTPRGRHLPQGTHTPPQSSRRPRQRTLAHPARLLASLSRPPVCANLPAARRLQAVADLGEGGAQWSHQAHHRQRHPVVRS